MTRDENWLLKEKYRGVESVAFRADCERLTLGEPLGYVIGYIPFLNCQIWLDTKPLIPRAETEFWVEKALKEISVQQKFRDSIPKFDSPILNNQNADLRVLDLCAGSGAIGVAVAKAVPEVFITFAEIDPVHLPTIEKNFLSNIAINRDIREKRCEIVESDLFENITGQFDFILTNPPYIDVKAETVEKNVTTYEPHLALFGGEGGMEIIEQIVAGAGAKLRPHTGQLWIEHEPAQVTSLTSLAHQYNFQIVNHPDQYGSPRFSVLTMA